LLKMRDWREKSFRKQAASMI